MNANTPISKKEINMASSLAPLLLFLLASSLLLGMGVARCNGYDRCLPLDLNSPCGDRDSCRCVPVTYTRGRCVSRSSLSLPSVAKEIEAHPNLCQSHGECVKKGSGNFCSRFPNPQVEHGWCVDSPVAMAS